MSGYIGILPVPQATETRNSFTATSNQTSFTTDGYTPNFVSVYLNGVLLSAADFTATNGTDVVLASGAAADDVVEVIAFSTFQSANALPLTGGSITGNVSFGDNNKAIFGAGSDLEIFHDASNSYIKDGGTGDLILLADSVALRSTAFEYYVKCDVNGAVSLYHDNAVKLATTATGATITGTVKPTTYQETYVAKSAASTVTCDLATGTSFSVTLDQNTTFAFTNPPSSGTAFSFTLFITQHSTAVTLTWPGTVDWAGGSAPDAAAANEVQAYGFFTRDGGTTYYGFLGGSALG
jgi:hypothetical protein